MKKSILTLLLALLLALALCACGGETAGEPAEAEETETAEAAETAETEEAEAPEGGSRLAAVFDSMDPEAGIHMTYDVLIPSIDDSLSRYEVHSKGGTYYARQSLLKDGYEDYDTAKFIQDGMYYSLHLKEQDGVCMSGPSTDTAILTDSVYSAIRQCQDRDDFTAGQTEFDGVTYDSETFPATAAFPMEQTFCFDPDGNLAVCIMAANEDYGTPEIIYIINVIDDQVDESLFDISAYTITEQ